ncbi:unnamed protein product, partial [Meganyctiphanes norvegica]
MKGLLILLPALIGVVGGRGTRGCGQVCPKEIDPVCGSDDYIYSSLCDMKRLNCGKDVLAVRDSQCLRSSRSDCNHKCSQVYDPVCAADGRTYLNKCIFRVEQCR